MGRKTYDETIDYLSMTLQVAKVGNRDRSDSLLCLEPFRQQEKSVD